MGNREHRARGQARRTLLLQAAIEVIAEVGYEGVTHRAVTERAGLPLSSVGYFFPSIDDLADAAIAHFTEQHVTQQESTAAALRASGATPDAVIAAFAAAAQGQRPYSFAIYEALLHAGRHERARENIAAAVDATCEAVQAGAELAGAPDPPAVRRAVMAMILGYGLQESVMTPDEIATSLPAALRTTLIGALFEAGDEEGARRLRDAHPSPTQ